MILYRHTQPVTTWTTWK